MYPFFFFFSFMDPAFGVEIFEIFSSQCHKDVLMISSTGLGYILYLDLRFILSQFIHRG